MVPVSHRILVLPNLTTIYQKLYIHWVSLSWGGTMDRLFYTSVKTSSSLLASCSVVALSILVMSAAWADPFQRLGTGDNSSSTATGISANGSVVVGSSFSNAGGSPYAFRWTVASKMQNLGVDGGYASYGSGISSDGSVVAGTIVNNDGSEQAFRWTSASGVTALPLPAGTWSSFGNAASGDGQVVVGSSYLTNSNVGPAFSWSSATGSTMIDSVANGSATAASADGSVIVGYTPVDTTTSRAFRWTSSSGLTILPGNAGDKARAVNADGSVVAGDGSAGAFRWTAITGTVSLGAKTSVQGMNADGTVLVGSIDGGAARWTQVLGWQSILAILAANGTPVSGIMPTSANAVSADGTAIVGVGRRPYHVIDPDEAWLANIPVNAFAQLDLAGANKSLGSLVWGGTVNNYTPFTTATLTVGSDGTSTTFSGNIIDRPPYDIDSRGIIALVKTGGGTLTLTGDSNYHGGTTITRGVLQIGDGGTKGTLQGDVLIVDNATLVFNRSDLLLLNGNISIATTGHVTDRVSIRQIGTGETALTGDADYLGRIEILAGALQFARGDNTTFFVHWGDITDNGTLKITRPLVLNSSISGSGGVVFGSDVATDELRLIATSTYTGATQVYSGKLTVLGSIANSPVTVSHGATLQGNGTVGPTTIQSGGMIDPGWGTGTLSVAGDLTLMPGSTYFFLVDRFMEYAATGFTQRQNLIAVTGKASLSGALQVHAYGPYVRNAKIPVVTAAGGITGTFETFDGARGFGPLIRAVVRYDANSAYILLAPLSIRPMLPTNASANQVNVATAVDYALANAASPEVFADLGDLGSDPLKDALDQLSGEAANAVSYAGLFAGGEFLQLLASPSASFEDEGMTSASNAQHRTRLAFNGPAEQTPLSSASERGPLSVWGTVLGGWSHTKGDPGGIGSHNTTAANGGLALGLEYDLADSGFAVGAAVSMGEAKWTVATGLGSGRATYQMIGLYSSKHFGAFYASGAVDGAQFVATTDRAVNYHGVNYYRAHFHAQEIGARLEIGRRFSDGALGITPYAAVQGQQFRTPGYAEAGPTSSPLLALSYAKQTIEDANHELGVQVDQALWSSDPSALRLGARLGWIHDYSGASNRHASFTQFAGTDFKVNGNPIAQDAARVALFASSTLTDELSISARALSELSQDTQSYAGSLSLAYHW